MKRQFYTSLKAILLFMTLFVNTNLKSQCVFPFTEDFSTGTNGQNESPLSNTFDFNCMTYKINGTNSGVALQNIGWFGLTGPDFDEFTGPMVVGDIMWTGSTANGVSTFSMGATDQSTNFRLTSLDWLVADGGVPTVYTLTGYDNGMQVAQVIDVDVLNQTATNYAEGTVNQVNAEYIGAATGPGYALHLEFTGTGWQNMDEIVFSVSGNDITMGLDNIVFSTAITGPLPLTLLSFTGRENADGILLQWKTADEVNTDAFDVERAVIGNGFEVVATVNANLHGGNYKYVDQFLSEEGAYLYRLKMRDKDGKFSYSSTLLVISGSSGATENYSVYPNPVTGNALYIRSLNGNKQDVKIAVVDMVGRLLYTGNPTEINGRFEVPVNGLPNGVYLLQVWNKDRKLLQVSRFEK